MNFELHIAPLSPTDLDENRRDASGTVSDASTLSLLTRIWMWLTQIWGCESYSAAAVSVFCLGPDDTLNGHRFQNLVSAEGLNRYRRRMLARYSRLRLSLSQVKAWVKARKKAKRFQTTLAYYFGLRFFRRAAFRLSLLTIIELGRGGPCNAPLTPD